MSAGRAKAFTKTLACPSSDDIFSRRLPLGKSDRIARHVAGCEFCAAEHSFLSGSDQTNEEYEHAGIRRILRRLAEALLVEKLKDSYKESKHGKESYLTRTGFRV